MPFGGVLAVFSENLRYFWKGDYNKPFCVLGLSSAGSEQFVSHEFMDLEAPRNGIWRMLLSAKSGNLYISTFDLKELENDSNFNFMNLSILG